MSCCSPSAATNPSSLIHLVQTNRLVTTVIYSATACTPAHPLLSSSFPLTRLHTRFSPSPILLPASSSSPSLLLSHYSYRHDEHGWTFHRECSVLSSRGQEWDVQLARRASTSPKGCSISEQSRDAIRQLPHSSVSPCVHRVPLSRTSSRGVCSAFARRSAAACSMLLAHLTHYLKYHHS